MGYSCWTISPDSRETILEHFEPAFPDVIAHHVTHQFGGKTAPDAATCHVIGRIIDPAGVDVLLVRIDTGNGPTSIRDDGKVYHMTFSIDRNRGKKPVHSNDAIETYFDKSEHSVFGEPIPILITPAVVV